MAYLEDQIIELAGILHSGLEILSLKLQRIEEEIKHLQKTCGAPPKEFLSAAEFGRRMSMSKNPVLRRCAEGRIKSIQIGGWGTAVRIPFSELEEMKKRANDFG